jgi:hypothetical protein
MFFHNMDFPLSMRTLFTGALIVLGIGYAFAMLHIYNSHAGRDGRPGISIEDISIAYSGSKDATRLEVALSGTMSVMLPADERGVVVGWARRGTDEQEYEIHVRPIVEKRCLTCHDGSNPHIPDLSGYEGITDLAELDTGMDIFTLVRVSHIHMFGMTFIFFVMGFIFSHAYVRPLWFKSAVIGVPFVGIIVDVSSWYLTKVETGFAWAVILGGAFMGASFGFQWVVSMYQMWFSKRTLEADPRDATIL